ncbi:recombination protein RecR [bacterium]|jgi:recombination protein RecR|nr:recombination protein RecR [bacterium]
MPRPHGDSVSKLIFELSKLPGIGEKTAARLSHYILKQDEEYARSLAEAIVGAKQKTTLCSICFTFTESNLCQICTHRDRNSDVLCVVEKPSDVFSLEQAGAYRGLYHVLHGALSPLDGIGPEELKIRELIARISEPQSNILEVIIATNPSVEGEATSLYLSRLLKPFNVKVTKLAHGLPVGGLLEYTDRLTIGKALENRMEIT